MTHELKSRFRLDARKSIWLIGITFIVIITFQYIELGNVFSQSSFLAGAPSSAESELATRNATHLTSLEYNGTHAGNETALDNEISEEWDTDSNNDFISKTDLGSNRPSTFDEGSNAPDESSTEKFKDYLEGYTNKSVNSSTSSVEQPVTPSFDKRENSEKIQANFSPLGDDESSSHKNPRMKKKPEMPPAVTTIADMNNLLYRSRVSYHSTRPRWSSAAEKVLLYARSQVENAPILKNDDQLYAPLFRNVSMFKRSYELMEKTLKVYVYKEGKRPIFHMPVLKGIYASEGWFMKQLQANKHFVTKTPREAQLFYIPFSSRMLEQALYVPDSHSHENLIAYLKNYVDMIAAKYPFWNRTEGADHFLVACHDWATTETKEYMANCIRALCNSDIREGYIFGKDVSLPETSIRNPQRPLRDVGGKPPSKRSILAFFAGGMHGYLRPILLKHWGNKDPNMKIFENMPYGKGKMNYAQHMKSSKYCICPRGYEVNSPRVVEAIFYECVPVIISDNFVPPLFEVFNWESFAVFVLEKDIPNLKNILLSIPDERYQQMQLSVKKVLMFANMDSSFRLLRRAQSRRLLLLIAITLALIAAVQYFELPYTEVFSSLFAASENGSFQTRSEEKNNNTENVCVSGKASSNGSCGLFSDLSPSGSFIASNISFVDVVAPVASPPMDSKSDPLDTKLRSSMSSANTSSMHKNATVIPRKDNDPKPPKVFVSISEMNDLLIQSHALPHSGAPAWSSKVQQEVISAKSQILHADLRENDFGLYPSLYRNVSMFKRSYELMESMLKIYIYQEGEKPIFHQGILEGIYASEGWFIKLMEANKRFVTDDPEKAHLFFIPFSSRLLELTLYKRNSHSRTNLIEYMRDYVDMIAAKHPFWNRSNGSDHFLAACHDWAPAETRGRLLNSIRALCNADIEVGFTVGKDVSLPVTYVRSAKDPSRSKGGNPPSERHILAFFAGQIHGYVRPILLNNWGKDPDMKIFGPMPHIKGNKNYIEYMKGSKFCICARGFAVHSPRVVEAIFYECVPIIISDNFVPPFFEILNWESFAVFVSEKDIPNLKNILLSISEERYMEMYKRVKMVQLHFLWHDEPVKYDLFHMILHSIWYNRVFQVRTA